jgi:type IV pilus assembly protein PilE
MKTGFHRGFTLVECVVVCAIVALLAVVAVPSFQGEKLRASRLDAVQALTKLQMAQEQYRAAHGLYAAEVTVLRGVMPVSEQGRYTITVAQTGPESYRATALARGAQTGDTACQALTLDVAQGWAQTGPTPQCWNR